MNRNSLFGLGVVIIPISLIVSDYIANIVNANYYAKYGAAVNDTDAMIRGLSVLCIYMPFSAASCAAALTFLGWFVMNKKLKFSLKEGFMSVIILSSIAMIISYLWSAAIYFFKIT